KAQLQYIGLEDATVKLQRTDSVWNYQFIVDYFSKPPPTSPAIKDTTPGLQLDLKEVDLTNINFLKRDSCRGEDMELRLDTLQTEADTISFSQKIARVKSLTFTKPDFTILNYDGRRPHPPLDTAKIINDPLHLRLNPGQWDLTASNVSIKNGSFRHEEK